MNLLNTTIIALLFLLYSCANFKGKLDESEQDKIKAAKKIAVISTYGDSFKVNSIGGTIFENSQYEVDIKSLKSDFLIESKVIRLIKNYIPNAEIDHAPELKSRVELYTAFNLDQEDKKLLKSLRKLGYQYLFLLTGADDGNNRFMVKPFGLLESQGREEVSVYQNGFITLYDLNKQETILFKLLKNSWSGKNQTEVMGREITVANKEKLDPLFIKKSLAKIHKLIIGGTSDALAEIFN